VGVPVHEKWGDSSKKPKEEMKGNHKGPTRTTNRSVGRHNTNSTVKDTKIEGENLKSPGLHTEPEHHRQRLDVKSLPKGDLTSTIKRGNEVYSQQGTPIIRGVGGVRFREKKTRADERGTSREDRQPLGTGKNVSTRSDRKSGPVNRTTITERQKRM